MPINVNGLFPGELTPNATVAGCVDIFENVWPNPEETIRSIENECGDSESEIYWERAGTVGDGAYQNHRTNKLISVTHLSHVANNQLLQNIHNQFYLTLLAATIPYQKRHGMVEGLWHEHYQLLKYSGGEEYKAHYDGGTLSKRSISALVYLNSDFVGGELEFPNFKVKIKPEPGMLILFPSNFAYRHIAHPVTEGTKYALVTWLRDQP